MTRNRRREDRVSKETYECALRDYIAGMRTKDIAVKWGISKSYIYSKMAKSGVARRGKLGSVANFRDGYNKQKKKLIPYAGKE